MRRTKQWWSHLTEFERGELVGLEQIKTTLPNFWREHGKQRHSELVAKADSLESEGPNAEIDTWLGGS